MKKQYLKTVILAAALAGPLNAMGQVATPTHTIQQTFTIPSPDYKLSPYTGMTRQSWIDAAEYLLSGAFTYIRTLDDPMYFPKQLDKAYPNNEGQVPTAKLEGFCRTLFVAAPLLREKPELTLNGIKVADYYRVSHYEFDLAQIMQYSDCALLAGSDRKIEHTAYAEQIRKNGGGKVSTYVPFRNGLMLSVAASLAAGLYENEEADIYIGAHADDAAGDAYADCSEPFLKAMGDAVSIGTYGKVRLVFPFATENKAGVVKRGLELGTPYELTWSCYEGGEVPCGTCATCIDRRKAFEMNGVKDPALK